MRTAEDILNIIRDRGKRGLPLEDIYRQLFKPALYLRAYDRLYRNEGAMTPGSSPETVDGMSLEKINQVIEELRYERFRWTPVRRTYIPKKDGKTRPLGIPTWKDKLVQEVMRSILEAYYEPQFSTHSHGFRPERGCHTALTVISHTWKGTKWFIEGDIKGCFDNINHTVLLSILREKLHDNRFLLLVESLLKAGYLEDWKYNATRSGTPQGGVVSPILANIYLDRLDQFVEQTLLPANNLGERRKDNVEYQRLVNKAKVAKRNGRHEEVLLLKKQYQQLPSVDPNDPDYRRLRYIRYADDFLLGYAGPKAGAEKIRDQLREFLQETLKLELSTEKTLITHATSKAARFLGYEVKAHHCDTKHTNGRRRINGKVSLFIPAKVIEERCRSYQRKGKAIHRAELIKESDFSIVATYQLEYQGYVQYYQLAENVAHLDRLLWVMQTSLLKTLAAKHKATVSKMSTRYGDKLMTPYGPRKCLKVIQTREGKPPLVAYFGGIPLRRKRQAILNDQPTPSYIPMRSELLQRLLADKCEVCGSQENVEVHHIRKLSDLQKPGRKAKPYWVEVMASRKRKTLVLCKKCHVDLHAGRLNVPKIEE
jgi:group II intron reverse transcriptase/maturase